ncbi:MAG: hypothetical protein CVV03_00415 [Firmicutes bacterium HGW-Firmicutes-8]|nr:MAG: hypothetical protein CVV03_00415 [Firmicutes bacterium HGW-Firmicutes-8]
MAEVKEKGNFMRKGLVLVLGLSLVVLWGLLLTGTAWAGALQAELKIPLKNKDIYGSGYVVGGTPWSESGQIIISSQEEIKNVVLTADFPDICRVEIPTQEITEPVKGEGSRITVTFPRLAAGSKKVVSFRLNTPEIKKTEVFPVPIKLTWVDQKGSSHRSVEQIPVEIRPAPGWWAYSIAGVGVVFLLILLVIARRFRALSRFSTQDLILIAVLAALGGVVFRWFWQTFNDLLGPLGGLLSTIPAAVLIITALHLVRKPGTVVLLMLVEELISSVVWGTNTLAWLGYYLLPGVAVDLLVVILGFDYADRPWTATLYAVVRSFLSYWLFYFFFAPALWKIYYAPWYSWMNIGIGCTGGLIGGFLGYFVAKRLREAAI